MINQQLTHSAPCATNYQRTASWLSACGKQAGNPQHLSVQIGVDLEETAEFLRAVDLQSMTGLSSTALLEVAGVLEAIGTNLKRGYATATISDREAALDALCDRQVTGDGVAFLAGFDKDGADAAVLDANDDKFDNGQPVILEGGKVGKRAGWVAPDLRDFI